MYLNCGIWDDFLSLLLAKTVPVFDERKCSKPIAYYVQYKKPQAYLCATK
jgi:hypothetical protein